MKSKKVLQESVKKCFYNIKSGEVLPKCDTKVRCYISVLKAELCLPKMHILKL